MAADPSLDWVSSLPWAWGYGITAAGRVFFINEEAKSTTWLHPVTGETVLTGHRKTPDLPTGWEEAYTFEGARYYINHNERKVTCKHPVSGQPSQDNCIFVVNDQPSAMTSQETKDRTVSMTSDHSNCNTMPTANPTSPVSRPSRSSGKLHNFGKRSNSIKRNPNAPVTMHGWLYKKANSGMKLWKKRWFVLSDLCLFYYRDDKEEGVLGSILLPSFQISLVTADDHINRAHAFKAAHSNMRTYYFCCDTSKEMDIWMRVMTAASLLHSEPAKRTDITKLDHPPPQEINHVANQRLLIRPETNNNQKNQEMMINRGEEKVFREAEKYGFQKDGQERPLTKISSVKHHSYISDYDFLAANTAQYRATHVNGPESRLHDGQGHLSEMDFRGHQRSVVSQQVETDRAIQRTNSMLQLEQWIRTQREKSPEEDTGGVMSYQTLPRNMPSYRAPVVPRYPEGYKTLPRNLKTRPDSVCSTTGMLYERTLVPVTAPLEEKRRSVRDDTMWQLYEWQQRQFYNKQSTLRRHSSLTSPKTMVHISDQTIHSIPMSPSHGSISGYHTYSPHRAYRSEVSSPVQRGDLTIERRQKPQSNKLAFAAERRSVPAGLSVQPITPQGLQGKTPEELTILLIKLRRQQAELSSIREHTLTQLLHLKQACSPKNEILSHHLQRNLIYVDHQMTQDDCRTTVYKHRTEELDIDAKLSRLCEQDKAVQALEQKLQQLHKEKYTLEQALLSASQEIEMNTDNPATVQSVVLQRDELQSGLLSTCREVSRATAELERSWREYDKLERDVTTARNQMRERLERLGEVQTESAGIQRAQMQKEIWRIQDVVEGLSKHKQQRPQTDNSDPKLLSSGMSPGEEEELVPPRPPLPRSYDIADAAPSLPHLPSDSSSSLLCYSRGPVHLPDDKSTHHVQIYQRNGSYSGPDYRLYKSEPELTTVAEVDESNGEDKAELMLDMEAAANKGSHFPVGVVPPRTKSPQMESSTIASYVTLRKNKKLDTKSERPRSAVEHLCLTESPRPRMTLEEQLERMRRHQAACLKEKKKGFSFLGSSDQSPSRSPSFSGENSVKLVQLQKKEEKIFSNIKDMENVVQERNAESSAQDVSRLKEVTELQSSPAICDKESGDVVTTEKSPAHEAKDDRAETSNTTPETLGNCLQVLASVPKHKSESGESVSSTAREAECSGILFSYDFSADTLRRQTVLDAGNLPSLPEAQELPVQPQLTEGSHFMCV
ncbi:pleckstrin homology domain-containing family A member 5 isoform X1 [Bufo gargarizans]|uniref:pleckstrin homology domain-containing family A member 5 isoform X1 n=1 Tax=Bufo gargarizans TaxID=30331 RepID=UPI001CF54690|nr:pleckstrin homology domain-containing family A member 5 isoform X1 [Bufo gargarizans]